MYGARFVVRETGRQSELRGSGNRNAETDIAEATLRWTGWRTDSTFGKPGVWGVRTTNSSRGQPSDENVDTTNSSSVANGW